MKDQIKQQIDFQRQKNLERKEEMQRKIEKSKEQGKYDFINNDMVLAFAKHLKEQHARPKIPKTSALKVLVSGIETRIKNKEIYIAKNSSVFDVISLVTLKFVLARTFQHANRSGIICAMNNSLGWEYSSALYLIEELVNLFPDKFYREIINLDGKSEVFVRIHGEFAEEVAAHEALLLEGQKSLYPMSVRPKDWSKFRDSPFFDPLITHKVVNKTTNISALNLDPIFETLNNIQKTAFCINTLVLDRAKEELRKGNMDVFRSKQHKTWDSRIKRGAKTTALRKIKSALKTATHYRDSAFYHAWSADFRSRIYSIDRNLDPQGSDLEKALHISAEPRPIGKSGARELKISLMGALGDDKISIDERIKKAESLLSSGILEQWVLGTHDGWKDADTPFMALSIANELVRFKASGEDYNMESAVFLAIDATCSGLQILAACRKDSSLAKLTNIGPYDQALSDLYTAVAEETVRRYEGPLKDFILTRIIFKRPVMCTPYSLTFKGAFDYIKEEVVKIPEVQEWVRNDEGKDFDEKGFKLLYTKRGREMSLKKNKKVLNFMRAVTNEWELDGTDLKAIYYLVDKDYAWHVWKESRRQSILNTEIATITRIFRDKAMLAIAPQAYEILNILQKWASIICASEKFNSSTMPSIRWTLPNGFVVDQCCMETMSHKIEAKLSNGTTVKHNIIKRTRSTDKKKHASSIIPNVVHSCDAFLMHSVINKMASRNMPMSMNHDSFSTLPGQVEEMGKLVREAFFELASCDPLGQVKSEFEEKYQVLLPDLPPLGDLDLNLILESPYAFR